MDQTDQTAVGEASQTGSGGGETKQEPAVWRTRGGGLQEGLAITKTLRQKELDMSEEQKGISVAGGQCINKEIMQLVSNVREANWSDHAPSRFVMFGVPARSLNGEVQQILEIRIKIRLKFHV